MFRYHGGFVQSAGPEGKVLVGHIGTSNVDLQVGFVGTVVAPNAQIDVRRPTTGQHKGSFFGARVEVFSNATSVVLHLPFDWSFICPRGDSDADGVSDCDDACPFNAPKSQPGVCGCAVADTDRDGDGLLDCKDACPTIRSTWLCSHDHDVPPPRDDPPLAGSGATGQSGHLQPRGGFGAPIPMFESRPRRRRRTCSSPART